LFGVPDIEDGGDNLAAQVADRFSSVHQPGLVDVRDQQIRADFGQGDGRSAPHALGRAGYQRHAAGEIEERVKHDVSFISMPSRRRRPGHA
jgi:hypothetical protein